MNVNREQKWYPFSELTLEDGDVVGYNPVWVDEYNPSGLRVGGIVEYYGWWKTYKYIDNTNEPPTEWHPLPEKFPKK